MIATPVSSADGSMLGIFKWILWYFLGPSSFGCQVTTILQFTVGIYAGDLSLYL